MDCLWESASGSIVWCSICYCRCSICRSIGWKTFLYGGFWSGRGYRCRYLSLLYTRI